LEAALTFVPVTLRPPRGRRPVEDRVVLRSFEPGVVRLFISGDLARRLGFDHAKRADILQGAGDDYGFLMLRPTAADNGIFLRQWGKQVTANLRTAFLAISAFDEPTEPLTIAHRVVRGTLVLDLRPLLKPSYCVNLPTTEPTHDRKPARPPQVA
jgi:hypothetical protein